MNHFTIQCNHCGQEYDDLLAECPACGEPHPNLAGDEYYDDPTAEGAEFYPEDGYLGHDMEEDYRPDPYAEAAYPAPEFYDNSQPAPYMAPIVPPPPTSRGLFGSTFIRLSMGCLSIFMCIGLYFGGIGVFAAYQGYQEKANEIQTQVQSHFNRGQAHLESGDYERAKAEFNYALSLDPNFIEARQALSEAEGLLASAPPKPTSAAQSSAAVILFNQAQEQVSQKQWAVAVQSLTQLRGLDNSYETSQVSDMLYTAYYQLGLQQLSPSQIDEAVISFEAALAERPNDAKVQAEQAKATLYAQAQLKLSQDKAQAIELFKKLHQLDATYLDGATRLGQAYEIYGDDLALQGKWCEAEVQYTQAMILQPTDKVKAKADNSGGQCKNQRTSVADSGTITATAPVKSSTRAAETSVTTATTEVASADLKTPATTALTPTVAPSPKAEATAPPQAAPAGGGTIIFSAYNKDEDRWLILGVPPTGGDPKAILTRGIMPAMSRDGRFLVYRSEAIESEGLHVYDFQTGLDSRATVARQDVLPRYGGDNGKFLYAARESAAGAWKVQQGFTDGKGTPEIVADGRTPDWASDGALVYQTTAPDGNNPGLYLAGFPRGPAERITTHESDRSPNFSPDGSQIAYMSTQGGNWDIYVVSRKGDTPRQVTTYVGNDGLPVWSPDGSQLAYVSDDGGSWAIYVIGAAGGTPTKVTAWSSLRREDWLMEQIAWR